MGWQGIVSLVGVNVGALILGLNGSADPLVTVLGVLAWALLANRLVIETYMPRN